MIRTRFTRVARLVTSVVLLIAPAVTAAQAPPYRDRARPVDERVRDLLARMTPEEKFWQAYMAPGDLDSARFDWSHGAFGLQVGPGRDSSARGQAARIDSIGRYFTTRTRLGIPIIPFEEALHGLMRPGATAFPQAIGLAATFDPALMADVASAIARETRSRGIRHVLSPVVNIASDVRWGRTEETYGEDPLLVSRMGSAFVHGFERAGVIATPKHFVANVGEGGRDSYPVDVSRRMLEQRYFPPFAAAVRSGARSIMSAYNSVDGIPASQNRTLLTDVLRGQWGFRGFVISDAAATSGPVVLQRTEANTAAAAQHALEAGLDVIFQSNWAQHRPYLAAFRSGRIADSVIDRAVSRVLRAKFELGLFDDSRVNPDSAAYWNGHASHRALAREAARAGMVLLHNERNTLPLAATARSVAVIGQDATEARLGGYSGPGVAPVSILAGLRERLGARVAYAAGPGRLSPEHEPIPPVALSSTGDGGAHQRGLRGEYWDTPALGGTPKVSRVDERVDFLWTLGAPGPGIPLDWYSARWTGRVTVPAGGIARRIGVEGNDGWRLYVDGRLAIDNWRKRSYGTRLTSVRLAPGTSHDIRLEYFETTGNARVRLVWDTDGASRAGARIDEAVALARRSAVAVVVAGIEEGEFRDRASLALPGHQEELIRRVAATGTPTVVVIVGGSAVTMSRWIDQVGAVLMAWYPGEEGGRAIADVLLGDADPGGRLPITFPMAEGQLPLSYDHEPTGRGDDYLDLTGRPLFPFGHGLSYTRFEYSGLTIDPPSGPDGRATVRFLVRNAGTRKGDEVVQLYLRDMLATVGRPVLALRGFARVTLRPGQENEIMFTLGREELQLLDRDMRWTVEPGTFRVLVGASSADIRLRGDLVVP